MNRRDFVTVYVHTRPGKGNEAAHQGRNGTGTPHLTLFTASIAMEALENFRKAFKGKTGSLSGVQAAYKDSIAESLKQSLRGVELGSFLDPCRYGNSSDHENYGLFGNKDVAWVVKKFAHQGDIAHLRWVLTQRLCSLLGMDPTEPTTSACREWFEFRENGRLMFAVPSHSFARNFEPHLTICQVPDEVLNRHLYDEPWSKKNTSHDVKRGILGDCLRTFRAIPRRLPWYDFTPSLDDVYIS